MTQMSYRVSILLALGAICVASACAATVEPESTTADTGVTTTIDRSTTTTAAAGDVDPMERWIESALDDLSDRVDVERDSIEVLSVEGVTWSDGSLGCPVDGQFYTQALVPGYRIELGVEDQAFSYHGADGQEPAFCESPQDPVDG